MDQLVHLSLLYNQSLADAIGRIRASVNILLIDNPFCVSKKVALLKEPIHESKFHGTENVGVTLSGSLFPEFTSL